MLEGWNEYFVAAAGACAALAGLIIVAMSVSIDQLVKARGMTSRAATAVAMLVLVTVVSLAGLIPSQSDVAFGIEVLALATFGLGIALHSLWVLMQDSEGGRQVLANVTKGALAIVPFLGLVIGGVLVITGSADGLFWMAMGSLGAIVVAVIDAWVMLVEIRR